MENRSAAGLTLVMANTVERAQKLHAGLRRAGLGEEGLVLIHSRFRPPDRARQMEKALSTGARVVVATQALEAGIDISAAVLVTELAPWASLVQRFGRANRYGERNKTGGAPVFWIDLPDDLAAPYEAGELCETRRRLAALSDVRPSNLPGPGAIEPPRRVIRRKDLIDLFDTDLDLTGFDVDISPYVRDAHDTDIRVFWRDLSGGHAGQPDLFARRACAIPIGRGAEWKIAAAPGPIAPIRRRRAAISVWVKQDGYPGPGLTLMLDVRAGGYDPSRGFHRRGRRPARAARPGRARRGRGRSGGRRPDRRRSPERRLCGGGLVARPHRPRRTGRRRTGARRDFAAAPTKRRSLRAARWHDLGKAHDVFQDTMRRGLRRQHGGSGRVSGQDGAPECGDIRRAYFRHELASALAWLAQGGWSREADLVGYLIAAHHGKVRMSLRAFPAEPPPDGDRAGARYARGIWEGDELREVDLGEGERWGGEKLTLSIMELGEHEDTRASWTERTRALLDGYGPFRLAWLEALLRIADWRASAEERGDG